MAPVGVLDGDGRSVRRRDEYSDVSHNANETGGGELVKYARTWRHEQPIIHGNGCGDD